MQRLVTGMDLLFQKLIPNPQTSTPLQVLGILPWLYINVYSTVNIGFFVLVSKMSKSIGQPSTRNPNSHRTCFFVVSSTSSVHVLR